MVARPLPDRSWTGALVGGTFKTVCKLLRKDVENISRMGIHLVNHGLVFSLEVDFESAGSVLTGSQP